MELGGTGTVISSRENKLVKAYNGYRTNKAKRHDAGLFVVEGARLVHDAIISGAEITDAFVTADARLKFEDCCSLLEKTGAAVYEVTPAIANALADTRTPQGIFCIVKMRKNELDISKMNPHGSYLALENLQDPGNLGMILRTAEAMGIDGVILSSGCVDIYSPKVVRASMGAVFRIKFAASVDLISVLSGLKSEGHNVYAAVAHGGEDIRTLELKNGAVAVIGNEGNGLTDDCADICNAKLTVRMGGRAESLNAAAAATVILWEMTKHRS